MADHDPLCPAGDWAEALTFDDDTCAYCDLFEQVAERIAQAIEADEEFRHGRCRTDHVAGLGVCQTHGSPWAAGRFCDRMMARTHAAEIARSFGPRPVDNEPGESDA